MYTIKFQGAKNKMEFEYKTLPHAIHAVLNMIYRPVSRDYTITFTRQSDKKQAKQKAVTVWTLLK